MLEPDDDQPAIKALGPVTVVLRDTITREQQACIRLERKRIPVLLLNRQIVFPYKSLKDTVIIDVLGRQVREDISQLSEKLSRFEPFIQRLPGYI